MRRILTVLGVIFGLLFAGSQARAQEIQLTGPLAGAPAVRALRLHRQGRLEIAPAASFTLLDEYQHTIFLGGRLSFNLTDWVAIGVWGAAGAIKTPAALSDHIQEVTSQRYATEGDATVNSKLTAHNVGADFKKQLGTMDYVVAPQLTAVPFRGKLAIFQKIFVDTDAYLFGGPALVGVTERADCNGNCAINPAAPTNFAMNSRTAVTGTFGLGLNFYMGKFMSLGVEWRALPFAWNTGGFDTHGGGPGQKFPDNKISDADREFKFNQLLTVSLGFFLPASLKRSE